MSAHRPIVFPDAETLAKLPPDGGPDYNRLVFESSPYLLQHAANPVDWYPWGEEAFARARREDKPIFLSIGYATCHWCHVMERESFEDARAAAALNEVFVCIKVDKEERPDLDDVYMSATQAMTGHGGWPMTVLLTHDKRPFFAGTYYPRESRGGRIGLIELVRRVGQAWQNQRDTLVGEAGRIAEHLAKTTATMPGRALEPSTLRTAFSQLADRFDEDHGGFGTAPKFPTPHNLTFLLRYGLRTGEPRALAMVANTLAAMRRGGIFDHVGFGFHRYSTDAQWLLPHFEKMLYDQALLAIAYLEAAQVCQQPAFGQVAREIFTYVLRDMTDPAGGFYSAEDADSEGEEGKFYVWKPEEIHEILGTEEGSLFCQVFQIVPGGNFRDEASGHRPGDSIPHLPDELELVAQRFGHSLASLRTRIEAARARLFEHRRGRIHPLKDDKILTDWNGLMIAALALGARVLNEPAYVEAASKAARFVLTSLRTENGRLLKRYRAGKAGLTAHLDDYAYMIWGLLELYTASAESAWLSEALALAAIVETHFNDAQGQAYHFTANDSEQLFMRTATIYDGASPSGNSVMTMNLLRLGKLTGEPRYCERAAAIFAAFSGQVGHYPSMSNHLMGALDFLFGPTSEVVIVGTREADDTRAMLTALQGRYLGSTVVLVRQPQDPELDQIAPFSAAMNSHEGRATAYVCRDFTCAQPVYSVTAMLELLDAARS